MKSIKIEKGRYILDPLYGIINLPDYVWQILFIPEMQRLREVRLYNINSLYFTGGANINRYEHSIGTCHLASICVESNFANLQSKDKMLIVLAALLHDLYNAAFGHSVEYVEKFSPASLFPSAAIEEAHASFKYKSTAFEPIYFGMCQELHANLTSKLNLSSADISKIGKYINGKGNFGTLISGTIDLDNIDNVFRMSYHMGLTKDIHIPVQLAKSMWCQNGNLCMTEAAVPLVNAWRELRKRLYKFLLLNPDEFSAKFMLTEAIELSKKGGNSVYTWYDTDFQILDKLAKSTHEVLSIVSRLMKGELYGCFGIYSTSKVHKFESLSSAVTRRKIERDINELIQPIAIRKIPEFSAEEQKAIGGILGIYYIKETGILRLTHRANKIVIDKLTANELKKHKAAINLMYLEMKAKLTAFKLKNAMFGVHVISDFNKTNREVVFTLPNRKIARIGHSTNRLYIGVFIKNSSFTNFNSIENSVVSGKIVENVKAIIKDYLVRYLGDSHLEDLALYCESENA